MTKARCNPGAAKAADCEISKSFCALARRCYEARHSLEAPLIDVCSEAETHRFRCGRVVPRVSVDPNCGIRAESRHRSGAICLRSLSPGTFLGAYTVLGLAVWAKLATRRGQGRAVSDCCTGRGPLIARTTGVGGRKNGSVNRARFAERTMSAYRLQLEARISEPQLAKARKFTGKYRSS